ncbi:N-acetylhexosaminidase [Pholiota molesta]|nr:N-acetylhexosaminidase [Pholiota molesta]
MLPKVAVVVALLFSISPASALWPAPRQITNGTTASSSRMGSKSTSLVSNIPIGSHRGRRAYARYLATDNLQALVVDRGASSAGSSKQLNQSRPVKSISQEAIVPLESRVEGYTLVVPADGSAATLTANSTLAQWHAYTLQAPFNIVDSPAYPYRGFMLDTARNFFPIADLKRTLDAMSWVKINTFHWHVVDSQSFPLVIPGFTELSAKAAYNAQSVYTPAEVKDLVVYAAARGIDVIAEIDTPGHTSAISKSHPEFIACPEATPWSQFANEPPAGQLRVANAAATNFTSSLLTSAASLFTSTYFGTGGDEINANCYAKDAQTQAELTAQNKTLNDALDTFTQANHGALKAVGKTAVVWEGQLLAFESQRWVWISADNVAAVVEKGFRVVHSSNDYFYLDCGHGGWVGQNVLGNSWCDPFKTWQKSYSFDPLASLTPDQHSLVLGGPSTLLWTEQSSSANLDSIVWPRAASSAELFWTGPGGDVGAALPRLHDISYRFRQRGVNAIALQPEWCALRPGACDLNA